MSLKDLYWELRREFSLLSLQFAYFKANQIANTKKAGNVTLEELARYVLDGKPIIRNNEVAVYEPAEPSTDRTAESK